MSRDEFIPDQVASPVFAPESATREAVKMLASMADDLESDRDDLAWFFQLGTPSSATRQATARDFRAILSERDVMIAAINTAADRFDEYADLHAAKPDMEKSTRNRLMALHLRAVVEDAALTTKEG